MSKIVNTDLLVLGDLRINAENAQGKVLTIDPSNKVSFRTISEIASDGADKNYEHDQASPSAVWNITHNLNKRPSILVVNSSNEVVVGAIEYIDLNNVQITFNGSFSGYAYLN